MTDSSVTESVNLSPRVRYRAVGDEGVVVHLDSARVIVVSEVGLCILNALSSPTTRESLVTDITNEYDVEEHEAREDINKFLEGLNREKVVYFDSSDIAGEKDV